MESYRTLAYLMRYALIVVFLLINNYTSISQEVDLSFTTTYSHLPPLESSKVRLDNKLFATIVLNDFSFKQYNVRLKLSIEGEGVLITSSNLYNYRNFTLIPGVPKVLSAFDLGDYFAPESLDFAGIDKNTFLETGTLPEGNYKLCFTVVDGESDGANELSIAECDYLSLQYIDAPIISSSISEAILTHTISWKSNTSVEGELEYELEVYEYKGGDVKSAPNYQLPLKRIKASSQLVDIEPIMKTLEKDKLYVFFIHASSKYGFNHFIKNKGFSGGLLFESQLRAGDCIEDPVLQHEIFTVPGGQQYIHFFVEGCDPYIPPQYPNLVRYVYPYDEDTGYDIQINCDDGCKYDFEFGDQNCVVGDNCTTDIGCYGKMDYGCECDPWCVQINLTPEIVGGVRTLVPDLPPGCDNPQYQWSDGSTSPTIPFPNEEATFSLKITCASGCTYCGIINSRGNCFVGNWCSDGNPCTIFDMWDANCDCVGTPIDHCDEDDPVNTGGCAGDLTITVTQIDDFYFLSASIDCNPIEYMWNENENLTSSSLVLFESSGQYTLDILCADGCSYSASLDLNCTAGEPCDDDNNPTTIEIYNEICECITFPCPDLDGDGMPDECDENQTCHGSISIIENIEDQILTVDVTDLECPDEVTYLWTTGAATATIPHSNPNATYSVTVTCSTGCQYVATSIGDDEDCIVGAPCVGTSCLGESFLDENCDCIDVDPEYSFTTTYQVISYNQTQGQVTVKMSVDDEVCEEPTFNWNTGQVGTSIVITNLEALYIVTVTCADCEFIAYYSLNTQDCVVGAPCIDGEDCTAYDTYNDDCECVGIPMVDVNGDPLTDCDEGPCTDGLACDDGDPCTYFDLVYSDACCIGFYLVDGDGNVGEDCGDGPCIIGAPCNDGDPCTTGDIYDANCDCAGEPILDGDGVPITDCEDDNCTGIATITTSLTEYYNKVILTANLANCDSDVTYEWSNGSFVQSIIVSSQTGTYSVIITCGDCTYTAYFDTNGCIFEMPCDDGNPCTLNDTYNNDCECIGEAIYDIDFIENTIGEPICDYCLPSESDILAPLWSAITIYSLDLVSPTGEPITLDYQSNNNSNWDFHFPYCIGDISECDPNSTGSTSADIFQDIESWLTFEGFSGYIDFSGGPPCGANAIGNILETNVTLVGMTGISNLGDPVYIDFSESNCQNSLENEVTEVTVIAECEISKVSWSNGFVGNPILLDNISGCLVAEITCADGCVLSKIYGNCDDCQIGAPCTIDSEYDGTCIYNAVYNANCECIVESGNDTDNDGVCDEDDICPGSDDNLDDDGDGVPDGCDECHGQDDNNITNPDDCGEPPCNPELTIIETPLEGETCDYCLDLNNDLFDATSINYYFSNIVYEENGELITKEITTNYQEFSFTDFDVEENDWSFPASNCSFSDNSSENPLGNNNAYSGLHSAALIGNSVCSSISSNSFELDNSCQIKIEFWIKTKKVQQGAILNLAYINDNQLITNIKDWYIGQDFYNIEWTKLTAFVDNENADISSFKLTFYSYYGAVYIDDITLFQIKGNNCFEVPTEGNTIGANLFSDFITSEIGVDCEFQKNGECGTGNYLFVENSDINLQSVSIIGEGNLINQQFVSEECGENGPGAFAYELTAEVEYCGSPSFLWSNGETAQTIIIPQAANYSVTVFCGDEQICSATESTNFNVPDCTYGGECSITCTDGTESQGYINEYCECIIETNDYDGDGIIDCLDPCPYALQVDNNENGIPDCLEPPCNCLLDPKIVVNEVETSEYVESHCIDINNKCQKNIDQVAFGSSTLSFGTTGFSFPYNFNCDEPGAPNGINSFLSDLHSWGTSNGHQLSFVFSNDQNENCTSDSGYDLLVSGIPAETDLILFFDDGSSVNDQAPTKIFDVEYQFTVDYSYCSACTEENIVYSWSGYEDSNLTSPPNTSNPNYAYTVTVTCGGNCVYELEPDDYQCIVGIPCDDADPCTENDAYDENCFCSGQDIGLNTTTDTDGDGICNAADVCPSGDDNIDSDYDTVPDYCDVCPGGNDLLNSDSNPNNDEPCDPDCEVEDLTLINSSIQGQPPCTDESYSITGFTVKIPILGSFEVGSNATPQLSANMNFDYCYQNGTKCPGKPSAPISKFESELQEWLDLMQAGGSVTVSYSASGVVVDVTDSAFEIEDITLECIISNQIVGGSQVPDTRVESKKIKSKVTKSTSRGGATWGGPCDDKDECTFWDHYDEHCNCEGIYLDSDNDFVCDPNDQCPNWPDYLGCGQHNIICDDGHNIPICEYYFNLLENTGSTTSDLLVNGSSPKVIQFSQLEVQCRIKELILINNGNVPGFDVPGLAWQLQNVEENDYDDDDIIDLLDMAPTYKFDGYYSKEDLLEYCYSTSEASLLIFSFMFDVVNTIYDSNDTNECSTPIEGNSSCLNEDIIKNVKKYDPGCASALNIQVEEDELCILRDKSDGCPIEFYIDCQGYCAYRKFCEDDHVEYGCDIECDEIPCQVATVVQLNVYDPLDPDWAPACDCVYTDLGDEDGDTVCDDADQCPGYDDLDDPDGDNIPSGCDECPNIWGVPGDSCDDGNSCTYGDRIIKLDDGSCQCTGYVVDYDSDGIVDCEDCESRIDYDGDGVADNVEYIYFEYWDEEGNLVEAIGCDACPGLDDLVDTDEDGLPDCLDRSTYDIGCPIDVITIPGEGIVLIFSTDDVLVEDIPNPIQFSSPIIGGNGLGLEMQDYLLYDNVREVDGTFEVFYSIPGFSNNFPYAVISYSDHQPCVFPDMDIASINCPSNISITPGSNGQDNIVLEFEIPEGFVYDIMSFVGEIIFDLQANGSGEDIISDSYNPNMITEGLISFPESGNVNKIQVVIPGFYDIGDIQNYTGNIILPNGYVCPIAGGTTTSECDDSDGNPISAGDPCDDDDPCTHHDVYYNDGTDVCKCSGDPVPDSDGDGYCDAIDECPDGDDADNNFNGVPDGCECDPPVVAAYATGITSIQVDITNDNSGNPITIELSSGASITLDGTYSHSFDGLVPGTTYEIFVKYECSESTSVEVQIPGEDELTSFCDGLLPIDPTTISLLESLSPGDIIKASDFNIVVDKAIGSNGVFSGKGHVEISYFNLAKLNVNFKSITISENYELVKGKIVITGLGQNIIPDEWADYLNDFLDLLDNLSDLLGDLLDFLDELEIILDQINTLEEYNNIKASINSFFDIIDGNPFIPDDIKDQFEAALNCFENIDPQDQVAFDACKEQLQAAIDALQEALTELFNADSQITFEASEFQKYGFDLKEYNGAKGYIAPLTIAGESYDIPWKSIKSGESDYVDIIGMDAYDISTISFMDMNEVTYDTESDGNSGTRLVIPATATAGVADNKIIEVYAVHTTTGTDGNDVIKLPGKINIIIYPEKEVNIKLIRVNNSTSLDDIYIGNRLDDIYQSAIVNTTFSIEDYPADANTEFDDFLDAYEDDGMYNDEMKSIICPFKEDDMFDPGELTFYFFLINEAESETLEGFMPHGKGFGFIVDNPTHANINEYIARTVAHELGHGAYSLHHFPGDPPSGNTDNLMDYSDGTDLTKYQWDVIHKYTDYLGVYNENTSSESNSSTSAEDLANKFQSVLGEGSVVMYELCDEVHEEAKFVVELPDKKYRFSAFVPEEDDPEVYRYEDDIIFKNGKFVSKSGTTIVSLFDTDASIGNEYLGMELEDAYSSDGFLKKFHSKTDLANVFFLCESTYSFYGGYCMADNITSDDVLATAQSNIEDNANCPIDPITGEVAIDLEGMLDGRQDKNIDISQLQTMWDQADAYVHDPSESGVSYVLIKGDGAITLRENYHGQENGQRDITDPAEIQLIINRINKGIYFKVWDTSKWNGNVPTHLGFHCYENGQMKSRFFTNNEKIEKNTELSPTTNQLGGMIEEIVHEKIDGINDLNDEFVDPLSVPAGEIPLNSTQYEEGEFNKKSANLFTYGLFAYQELRSFIKTREVSKGLWNPEEGDYGDKLINIPAPIAGGIDAVGEKVKELIELKELAGNLINDPQKTMEDLWSAVTGITPQMILDMVASEVSNLTDTGVNGSYSRAKALSALGLEIIMGAVGTKLLSKVKSLLPDTEASSSPIILTIKEIIDKLKEIRQKVGKPEFSEKVIALSNALKEKFIKDFYDDIDDFVELFSNHPAVVDVWKKLIDRPEWVRLNKELLEKLAQESDAFIDNVNKLYINMPFPADVKPPFPTLKSISFNGKIIKLEFNKFGFPKFWQHRTKIYLNGSEFNTIYKGDWKIVGPNVTHGAARSSDLNKASTWAINNYPPGKVRRSTTSGGKTSSSKIDILRDGGNPDVESDWITQTWHHHENGKDLIPVPSEIHNPVNHSGGHATRFGPDGTHLTQTPDTDVSKLYQYDL